MDSNEELAIRVKSIAEKMMEVNDFEAAHRFALKAQKLYADLENISQMLMVCEVHCAADQKLYGNEVDWHSILLVEKTADEATVKKQYRELAFQLHPVKHKFPGAEAAFKLIRQAKRVILDEGKQSSNDTDCEVCTYQTMTFSRSQQEVSHSTSSELQDNCRSNFMEVNLPHLQSQLQATVHGFSISRPTFWTSCPSCNANYPCYIELINKCLVCKSCSKEFFACEINTKGDGSATNLKRIASPQTKAVLNQGGLIVEPGCRGKFTAEHPKTGVYWRSWKKEGSNFGVSRNVNGERRRKQKKEPSNSCNKSSRYDMERGRRIGEYHDFDSSCAVKDKRCKGFTNDTSSTKKSCLTAVAKDKEVVKERLSDGRKQRSFEANLYSLSVSNSKSTVQSEHYAHTDSEFNDFDKERHESCFSAGQIWAIYATDDAMPRYYARIRKVLFPGFHLWITWLELDQDQDQDDVDETACLNGNIPVVCGNFELGGTEFTCDRLMFSHLVHWEKGSRKGTYKILPRKDEIWALYKNWDTIHSANCKLEYELVEILSSYTKPMGVQVASLAKVSGFVSLFRRIREDGMNTFRVPPQELFRFSHKVPSFIMTGEERDGVPKGCFELDPASLPENMCEIG